MEAVVLRALGGPEALRLETLPDLEPRAGEVVVSLKAAALNHRDVWIRTGQYAGIEVPMVLGSDGAGIVSRVGTGVDTAWIGQAVLINPALHWGDDERAQDPDFKVLGLPDFGTYAQQVRVPIENIHPKPAGFTFSEAAALPVAGLTAFRAVVTRAQVQPGETVLITGIGGGVSTFALQIAKALQARVIVTSGSDWKLDRAREMGADAGVNYRTAPDWPSAVLEALGGDRPDVVIDSVGGQTFAQALDLLRPGGRIALYGGTTGLPPEVNLRKIFWNQLSILGTTLGSPKDFAAMVAFYEKYKLKPILDQVFLLKDAADAHRHMDSVAQFGKIILEIPPEL